MPINIPTLLDEEASLPHYASAHAAGADVKAHIKEPLVLKPGTQVLVPTGLRMEIPLGFEIQVRPRSGLALNFGVTVLNTPGTIDADYRGEIGIILINHSMKDFVITPGMRIAQLVLAAVIQGEFISVGELNATARGAGGFGHTGLTHLVNKS